jgi:DNA-binding NarL/FixJ family response regulator
MEAGARGYLLKSDTAGDLVSAVEALRRGRSFFRSRVARDVGDRDLHTLTIPRQAKNKQAPGLTGREREVVQLLAEGHSSKEVASALHIATKTAETHRANIMRKIDCHSVVGVVRYAIRNQIIEA